jgi:hypothetical protein
MEGAEWTDERLDARMALIDDRFDRGIEEMRAMREEMRVGFAEMRGEIAAMRGDMASMRGDVSALRGDLSTFQRQVVHIVAAFAVGLLGVIAALIAATV